LKGIARFVGGFAAVGAAVAVLVNIAASLSEKNLSFPSDTIGTKIALMLFPPWIGGMAIEGTSYWDPVFFELAALNAALYAFLGFMTWLGIKKHRAFLFIEALLVLELWRRIIFLQ
jgi:hypothetical protein